MSHQNESKRILVATRLPPIVFRKLEKLLKKSPHITMAAFLRVHLTEFVEEKTNA